MNHCKSFNDNSYISQQKITEQEAIHDPVRDAQRAWWSLSNDQFVGSGTKITKISSSHNYALL